VHRRAFRGHPAYYCTFDAVAKGAEVLEDYAAPGYPSLAGRYKQGDYGRLVTVLSGGDVFVSEHVDDDPQLTEAERQSFRLLSVQALIVVPLIKGGVLIGGMVAAHAQPRTWSEFDIRLLVEAAERTWAALERSSAEAALRSSEERWRGLFERMHEGFVQCEMIYGPNGEAVDYRMLQLNSAWTRITGGALPVHEGQLMSEALPDLAPIWLERYSHVVETGEPLHVEWEIEGLGIWLEVIAYRTEPGRFAILFLDITERKIAERQQQFLLKLADRLCRASCTPVRLNSRGRLQGACRPAAPLA
jgi:PAS domain-containing protein